ncbi:MAG: DUF2959 domain-containing protein [Gammaproteobacteria bacterium]|nr:DUF2959 domain-containing protein [Gammaproteobacteria bacterium]
MPNRTASPTFLLLVLSVATILQGCATVQYAALEKVGVHKRDILVDRVEDARDSQDEAAEQFVSAYEQFKALVGVDGGGLERKYKKLAGELEDAEAATAEIDDRLDAVDKVARDLFAEWQGELGQYTNPKLRASSERNLATTRRRYAKLKQSMDGARAKIDPVLEVLQDNVLFLKHNLNAQALSSLRGEVVSIEGRVDALVAEMRAAISEANSFISDMGAQST